MSDALPGPVWKTRSGGAQGKGHPEIVACAASGEADRSHHEANRRSAPAPSATGLPQPVLQRSTGQADGRTVDNRMDNPAGCPPVDHRPPTSLTRTGSLITKTSK